MSIKEKITGIILTFAFFIGIFTGCTSNDGMKLSEAIKNSLKVKSIESVSEVSLKIKNEGINLTEEDENIFNLINNSTISLTSKSDVENNKAIITGHLNVDNITYDGKLYFDGEKFLLKIPSEPKYIVIEPDAAYDNYKQSKELQKQVRALAINFLNNYIDDYKFKFKNIKNKGTSIVTTPEGEKEITTIEVRIDTEEFLNLLKYTVNNLQNSNPLKEYFKAVALLYIEQDPSILEKYSAEEFIQNFEQNYEKMMSYLNITPEQIELFTQFFEIGPEGIVLSFGIDDENNIVKEDVIFDLIIKEGSEKINVVLKTNTINYNINKTTVVIPNISKRMTVKLEDYMHNFEDSVINKKEDFNAERKRILLKIGNKEAYINGNVTLLDVEPYIENETTLVPVRFVAESLGASVEWRNEDRSVIYDDGQKKIVMQIGNKTAYVNGIPVQLPTAPIIKNERAMVPLRFVSEQFGATVEWNGELKLITIEKE